MNKYIIYFCILLSSIFFTSCSSEKTHEYEPLSTMDFGEGTYRPDIINGLSRIPPFSWFGVPTPVQVQSEFEIEFNEDAIRSQSSGQLLFVDENGQQVDGIQVGNVPNNTFIISAKEGKQIIPVNFTVNPSAGNATLTGSVVIVGNGIDKVNDTEISNTATPIGSWTMNHKIGINWIQLTLLIIIAIILILAMIYIIKIIFVGITALINSISLASSTNVLKTPVMCNRESLRNNKDKDRDKKRRKRNPYVERCERILLSPASVSDKASTLEQLFSYWDYELSEEEKEYEGTILNTKVMMAMNQLWDKYYKYTKKNMTWSGEPYDSRLLPNRDIIPSNKNYSNIDRLTWGEIMNKHNYKGLMYHRGKPDFSEIAKYKVIILNFDNFVDPYNDGERGPLQEKAFELLTKQFPGHDIASMKLMKEKNRWVWHEDTDCKTLYLVPQEIHNNLNHFGGIGMLRILRSSGLV